jgi:hypothetical protein
MVEELATVIARSHERWMPRVVEAVFGTSDPISVARQLVEAVEATVGSAVAGVRFYEPGVGVVAGVDLDDGRAVVAKVHRRTRITRKRLAAIVAVQADLANSGAPVPRPLAGPVALADGWMTIEELIVGDVADGYDAVVRRGMAAALSRLVELARPRARDEDIGSWLAPPIVDDLWPEPHDLRFDFVGTAAGARWIDDLARTARATLLDTRLPRVVGHLDWRVQNLAFRDREVVAIFDWDSIGLAPEPAVVGSAAVIHPVDWRLGLPDPLPSIEQVDGFVHDYELARGVPFDEHEQAVLGAGQIWVAAYGARCQHADAALGMFPEVDHSRGWPRLLRQLAARR